MNKKTLIALAVILIAVIAVAAIFIVMKDSSAENKSSVNATIYIDGLGDTMVSEGTGSTTREIIESAFPNLEITYRSNGNINSIGGIGNSGTSSWVVFRWTSPDGWVPATTETKFIDGMSLAVSYTEQIRDAQGNTTYLAPDIDVEYAVYFFIQFKEQYDANDIITSVATQQERMNGIWVKGSGENSVAALEDAIYTHLLPETPPENLLDNYTSDQWKSSILSYDERRSSFGWLNMFMGWADTEISTSGGEYGTWTYWSQYTYDPDNENLDDAKSWEYNNWSLGQYDITEYKYFALILQTTTVESVNIPISSTPADIPTGL